MVSWSEWRSSTGGGDRSKGVVRLQSAAVLPVAFLTSVLNFFNGLGQGRQICFLLASRQTETWVPKQGPKVGDEVRTGEPLSLSLLLPGRLGRALSRWSRRCRDRSVPGGESELIGSRTPAWPHEQSVPARQPPNAGQERLHRVWGSVCFASPRRQMRISSILSMPWYSQTGMPARVPTWGRVTLMPSSLAKWA
jgi:hypothetical protein